MALLYDTYFVVALSFVIFVGILYRYKVHHMMFAALDARADRIRQEIDEARKLREQAQSLLSDYERRQIKIESEAAAMVTQAKTDAAEAAEVMKREALAAIDRRVKAAAEQLAAAEAAAVREVKDKAVSVAVTAATEVLRNGLPPQTIDGSIDDAIATAGQRLN